MTIRMEPRLIAQYRPSFARAGHEWLIDDPDGYALVIRHGHDYAELTAMLDWHGAVAASDWLIGNDLTEAESSSSCLAPPTPSGSSGRPLVNGWPTGRA